jgi:predicted nucleic acid-binding protein
LILYLDTSALVKLYVEEAGTDEVATWADKATAVATCRIAYAEARAAFARHRREGGLTATLWKRTVANLDDDWGRFAIVEVTDGLVRSAGQLADRYALRGFDAVHLAAALELQGDRNEIVFGCFDDRLSRAAKKAKLVIP